MHNKQVTCPKMDNNFYEKGKDATGIPCVLIADDRLSCALPASRRTPGMSPVGRRDPVCPVSLLRNTPPHIQTEISRVQAPCVCVFFPIQALVRSCWSVLQFFQAIFKITTLILKMHGRKKRCCAASIQVKNAAGEREEGVEPCDVISSSYPRARPKTN
jgi:hypothetical protein